jgi:hypothetical protein
MIQYELFFSHKIECHCDRRSAILCGECFSRRSRRSRAAGQSRFALKRIIRSSRSTSARQVFSLPGSLHLALFQASQKLNIFYSKLFWKKHGSHRPPLGTWNFRASEPQARIAHFGDNGRRRQLETSPAGRGRIRVESGGTPFRFALCIFNHT